MSRYGGWLAGAGEPAGERAEVLDQLWRIEYLEVDTLGACMGMRAWYRYGAEATLCETYVAASRGFAPFGDLDPALTDSPPGRLAWIVERFQEWTHSGPRPEDAFSRDRILTDVMLYWPAKSSTPTGVAVFAADGGRTHLLPGATRGGGSRGGTARSRAAAAAGPGSGRQASRPA